MTVRLLLFALLREIAATGEMALALPPKATVATALASFGERYPGAQTQLRSCRVAVNGRFVALDQRLSDGDELAFIPPVAGG